MVIRVKARKCEHYKLKYCLTSSLGILSYAEGSKTTDCQDTVLILGKRMRDSLDMGKHHVKNWPPHPKIDPLIPSGQTPQMISTYQYRRKSLWIHWSSSHPLELKSRHTPTVRSGEHDCCINTINDCELVVLLYGCPVSQRGDDLKIYKKLFIYICIFPPWSRERS